MDGLPDIVNRALRARGCSARQASIEAGSPELIRNIRRGQVPSAARLRALCEVLDLDFYIGPRREAGAVDEARLFEAVTAMERALAAGAISLAPRARAAAIVEVYELLDQQRSPATAARVQRLVEALASTDTDRGV